MLMAEHRWALCSQAARRWRNQAHRNSVALVAVSDECWLSIGRWRGQRITTGRNGGVSGGKAPARQPSESCDFRLQANDLELRRTHGVGCIPAVVHRGEDEEHHQREEEEKEEEAGRGA